MEGEEAALVTHEINALLAGTDAEKVSHEKVWVSRTFSEPIYVVEL